jgi:hypothetical protein
MRPFRRLKAAARNVKVMAARLAVKGGAQGGVQLGAHRLRRPA